MIARDLVDTVTEGWLSPALALLALNGALFLEAPTQLSRKDSPFPSLSSRTSLTVISSW